MGKTRELFRKTGDTKEICHARTGTIKDRNGRNLTEAKEIKKRWQEYTELYKKGLNGPDNLRWCNHSSRVRYPELWSQVDLRKEIPAELFQTQRDDAVKVLHSICQQIWKTRQWPQDWKRSVFIPILKKGIAKECSNYQTIAFISHASKVMLKILQTRLQLFINQELPDVQAGFRKGRGS